MERDELAAWLRLSLTPGVGNASARKLLAVFGLPDAVFGQSTTALLQVVHAGQAAALRAEPPELAALLAAGDGEGALAWAKNKWSPREQLAMTVGFEHFTAILANLMLKQSDVIEDLDGVYADMFMWHAVEETEHKAVAFDVYQAVDGDYWLRVRSMAAATFFFLLVTLRMQYSLLKHDNQLGNWRDALGFAKFMLLKPGMLTRIIPEYLDFYRPSFHPWQHDNRHLIVDRIKALAPHELKALNAA